LKKGETMRHTDVVTRRAGSVSDRSTLTPYLETEFDWNWEADWIDLGGEG
jgi:hypothetical protein